MPVTATDYDVVIVGSGLVGLALAAALARASLAVAIVDRAPLAAPDGPAGSEDWDSRVYAISPGSAEFLHALGAWQLLPAERVSAIEAMLICGDAGGELTFSAYELGERALAWIVENRELQAALARTVRTAHAIEVIAPCEPAALSWRADAVQLELGDGRKVTARLVVGADGVRSWTRAQAGLVHEPRPYGQTAIVANFAAEFAHRGRAFQWFLEDGSVLAWLPLPGQRVSIVWSAPEALAGELLALDAQALAERVGNTGAGALGKLEPITAAAAFPLSFLKLPAVVAHRLALVGDAAHGVHPLAGQGANLGFGDAAALSAVLAAGLELRDAGLPLLLERYARKRAEPVLAMQVVTDGLARLFGSRAAWLRALRNRGMQTVGALALVRRLLAQPALR